MLASIVDTDIRLFLWLNSHHSPFWDNIMWHISGKVEWLPLYLILIGYIVYKYRWQSIFIIAGIILCITLADQFAAKAFKEVFQRLRPTHNPAIAELVHTVNGYRGGMYGFVSNHAANTFAIAVYLLLLFKQKWFTVGILFWAALVSYSRIYLGVHFPGDILGGAALGSLIGWLVYFAWKVSVPYTDKILPKKKKARNG